MTTCNVKLSDLIAPAFYDLHRDIRVHGHTHYWLYGGRGSTKSSCIAIEAIIEMVKNQNVNMVCLRKQENTLRDSVYAKLCWAIDILGLNEAFTRSLSPLTITYKPTGQQILFRGTDKPETLKSLTFRKGYCGILWFEELDQFQSIEQVRNIRQSLVRGGKSHVVFYSYNPPRSLGNWVNTEAIAQAANGSYLVHQSDYRDVPHHWLGDAFFDEAEDLKSRNEQAYRHEYLGEITGSGTQVFTNLELREITDEEVKSFDRIVQGVDWGYYPDPFAYVKAHYDAARRTLYVIDEFTGNKMSNAQTGEEVKKRAWLGGHIICDSAEPKSIADFRALGLPAIKATKGKDSVQYGMKWLQTLTAIVIDQRRTPTTYREFSRYEYELNRQGEVIDAFPDADNHIIDALRYACERTMARRGA